MEKKVFAFDLDGTLTEHRTWITDENLAVLDDLSARGIRIVIAGAGQTRRIFTQMREHPVDIIGNYGLQYAEYRDTLGDLEILRDLTLPCDRESVALRIEKLRGQIGFTEYVGGSVEFHPSGCVTFPLLGTKADIASSADPPPSIWRRSRTTRPTPSISSAASRDTRTPSSPISATITARAGTTNACTSRISISSRSTAM